MDREQQSQTPTTQRERFIRISEVQALTGLGKSTIYDAIRQSQFPSSVPLPGGRVAWLQSEISDWQRARIALRDTPKVRPCHQPEKDRK